MGFADQTSIKIELEAGFRDLCWRGTDRLLIDYFKCLKIYFSQHLSTSSNATLMPKRRLKLSVVSIGFSGVKSDLFLYCAEGKTGLIKDIHTESVRYNASFLYR